MLESKHYEVAGTGVSVGKVCNRCENRNTVAFACVSPRYMKNWSLVKLMSGNLIVIIIKKKIFTEGKKKRCKANETHLSNK